MPTTIRTIFANGREILPGQLTHRSVIKSVCGVITSVDHDGYFIAVCKQVGAFCSIIKHMQVYSNTYCISGKFDA